MRRLAARHALALLGAILAVPSAAAAEEAPAEEPPLSAGPASDAPEGDATAGGEVAPSEVPPEVEGGETPPPTPEVGAAAAPSAAPAEPAASPPAAEAPPERLLEVPERVEEAEEPVESPPEGDTSSGEPSPEQVITTAAEEMRSGFLVWQWDRFDARLKPMIQVATGLVLYVPASSQNPDLATRLSTLLLTRFGFEGELFDFISFRIAFERNVGFSIARNGPVGTGVWEGTASMQSLENWVRLRRWGLSLTAGIVVDPASVDYISDNVLDLLGKDPYVRDPMLAGGLNQGQGVLLRYTWRGLTIGASYTGGNPLTSSLSYGFGGNVSSAGTLYTAPLRAMANGLPGSDIHMHAVSPSLSFENDMVGVRVAGQFYFVDVDATSTDDQSLFGYNVRATAELRLLDGMLRFFAGGAYRQNQQLAIPDLTAYRDEAYEGWQAYGGLDFAYGDFGVGGNYYYLRSNPSDVTSISAHYINVGATYWLLRPFASVGLRWARSMGATDVEGADPIEVTTDTAILSLRLLI